MAEKVFYGIVTQFDCPDREVEKFGFHRSGPMLYECMLKEWATDEAKVHERAKSFVGLGWVRVAKIIVDIPDGES